MADDSILLLLRIMHDVFGTSYAGPGASRGRMVSSAFRIVLSMAYPESRKVLNLPSVTIFPYQKLPPIFEVLIVDRALLRHGYP